MNDTLTKTPISFSLFILACSATLSLSACKKQEHTEPAPKENAAPADIDPDPANSPSTPSKAKIAAEVAVEISRTPEQADAILARHGMDRESLEALIFEIAKDPKLREAYNHARQASLASR